MKSSFVFAAMTSRQKMSSLDSCKNLKRAMGGARAMTWGQQDKRAKGQKAKGQKGKREKGQKGKRAKGKTTNYNFPPILYNTCKENRQGKYFCNSVAFVKYIFYERKGMQKIQRGMWHGFEVPTKTLGWRIWSWILTRSFGPFCSLEAGENAHNFFPGRAFIIPNSASFPTRNSFL